MAAYRSKTSPLEKQAQALRAARPHTSFALLTEMGTGKSKVTIDNAGSYFASGLIEDVVICCPNGLQRNWVDEFAKHCGVPYAIELVEGHMKAQAKRDITRFIGFKDPRIMRVLVISYDALAAKDGFDYCWDFIQGCKFLMALDESQRIKSTKRSAPRRDSVYAIGRYATYRRILSGTSSPNSPVDLYSQFKFLDPKILGFSTVTAFRAHYCQLLTNDRSAIEDLARVVESGTATQEELLEYNEKNHEINKVEGMARKMFGNPRRAKYMQIQAKSREGRPLYKNLDDLSARIAKFAFRARKDECLDLPPKIYAPRITFELSPKQRKIYDTVKASIIAEFVHKGRLRVIDSQLQITRLGRLAQIAANHYPDTERKEIVRIEPSKSNPRLRAVTEWIEDAGEDESSIIWAHHTAEIEELCEHYKGCCLRLDGTVKEDKRHAIIQRFQNREFGARKLIAQLSLGIGFDAYAASAVAYYTNSFNLEHRLQSEDRAHRKGLTHAVTYGDFEALDTGDARVIAALRDKREISEIIAGDPITNWI